MKRKHAVAVAAITLGTITTSVTYGVAQKTNTTTAATATSTTTTFDITPQQAQQQLDNFLTNLATTTTTTIVRPATNKPVVTATGDVWDQLAACECGGNWGCNTGNGYYGGLQFAATSWTGFGGTEFASMAHLATREQQIVVGERILDRMGWRAWPGCARKFGWL
jgi:hypothetical protein